MNGVWLVWELAGAKWLHKGAGTYMALASFVETATVMGTIKE